LRQVELFFILSGFILCHVYLKGFGEGRFRYGGFLLNRLARIYPLPLATLAAMGGLAVIGRLAGLEADPNIADLPSLPANLLLLHAWGFAQTAAFNHPFWSIGAEWLAYLSFPAFALAALRLRARPWLFVGLAVLAIVALYPSFQALARFSLTQATYSWGRCASCPVSYLAVPCIRFGARARSGAANVEGWPLAS